MKKNTDYVIITLNNFMLSSGKKVKTLCCSRSCNRGIKSNNATALFHILLKGININIAHAGRLGLIMIRKPEDLLGMIQFILRPREDLKICVGFL